MSRLPTPGGDDGNWGDILNDYLSVSLNSDGTIQNSAVSSLGMALDSTVVHTSANESISGIKTFASPPSVPTPVNPGDAVDKSYVDGSFVPKGSLVLNIMDYGALGNGVHDDTAALSSVLSALPSAGGTVTFPAGTYVLSSEVQCAKNNVRLQGAGAGATIIRQDSFDNAAIWIKTANCTVTGITFLSTQLQQNVSSAGINGATNHPCGIYASSAVELTVSGCNFINFVKGVEFNRASTNTYTQSGGNSLIDCGFSSCAWGLVAIQQSHMTIRGLHPCLDTSCPGTFATPGIVTITPDSMANIYVNSYLQIDDGAFQEQVLVTSTTSSTFTCSIALPHDGSNVPFRIAACYPGTQGDNPTHQVYISGNWNQRSSDVSISDCTDRNNPSGSQFALKFTDRLMVSNCSAYNTSRGIEVERCRNVTISNCLHYRAMNMGFEYAWNPTTLMVGDTRQVSLSITDAQLVTVDGCRFDLESPWYDVFDQNDSVSAGSANVTFTITQSCASIGLIQGSQVIVDIGNAAELCTVNAAPSGNSFQVASVTKNHGGGFPILLPAANTQDTVDTSPTAIGTVILTPASMSGICVGTTLQLGTTTDQEEVVVTAVTSTSFTCVTKKTHMAPFPITGSGFSDGVTAISLQGYTSSNDGGNGTSNVLISGCSFKTYYSSTAHAGGGGVTTSAMSTIAGASYVSFIDCEWLQSGDTGNGSGYPYYGWYVMVAGANSGFNYGHEYTTVSTGTSTYASGSPATIPVASTSGMAPGAYILIDGQSGGGSGELQLVASVDTTNGTVTTAASLSSAHTSPFSVQPVLPQGNINVLNPIIWNATSLAQVGTSLLGSLLSNVNFDLNADLLHPINSTSWTANSFKNYAGSGCRMQVRSSGLPLSLSGTVTTIGSVSCTNASVSFTQNFKTNNNGVVYAFTGVGAPDNARIINVRSNDSTTIIPNSAGNTALWSGANILLLSGVSTTNASTFSAAGATTLNCSSVTNMVPGMKLLLDPTTANQEVVTVASVNFSSKVVTTTANLVYGHSSGAIIVNCWQASNGATSGLGNSISFQFDANNWRQIGGGN